VARARVAGPLLVVALVVGAYHYSLRSLLSGLGLDTPLAYLGLVPLLALGMAVAVRARPWQGPTVADRQVDLLIGLPLIAAALVGLALLPDHLREQYWVLRVDLLTLPLFAAGVCAVVLGTRSTWQLRGPLAFTALAWPVPWTQLLDHTQDVMVRSTSGALGLVLHVVPVARLTDGDTGTFAVGGKGGFEVAVASACAGASSMLGFALLGLAATVVLVGSRRRRALWLASGVALVWLLNLLRIVLVLTTGRFYGRTVALDALHPVLGIATFAVGATALLLGAPRFGLQVRPELVAPVSAARLPHRPLGLRTVGGVAALALVAGLAGVAGAADGRLARNDAIVTPFGGARLLPLTSTYARPAGWSAAPVGDYPTAERYFGSDATWKRLLYSPPAARTRVVPVSVDVVDTSSSRALNAFSVAACYGFHRFDVSLHKTVALGGALTGELFRYTNPKDRTRRSTLAWQWPVQRGTATVYERVVLTVVESNGSRSATLLSVARTMVRNEVLTSTTPDPRRVAVPA